MESAVASSTAVATQAKRRALMVRVSIMIYYLEGL